MVNSTAVEWVEAENSLLVIYSILMSVILVIGVPGNVLAVCVLRHSPHRTKALTPLLLNIAIADLFMMLLGYMVVFASLSVIGEIDKA